MTLSANWSYPTAVRFGAGRIAELADACKAARHAISELGPDADRQALLARAEVIWMRQSRVRH